MQNPRPGISGSLFDATQRWTYLAIGLSSLVNGFADDTYTHVTNDRRRESSAGTEQQSVAALLPTASIAMLLSTQRWVFDKTAAVEGALQSPIGYLSSNPITAGITERVRGFLATQDARFQAEHAEYVALATEYLAQAGPKTLDELLARIDIDAFVDRVDVDDMVSKVDFDAVIDGVPVERVIEKIDLRAVVLETVGQVQMTDVIREGTNSTARALREQVTSATKIPGRTLRRGTGS